MAELVSPTSPDSAQQGCTTPSEVAMLAFYRQELREFLSLTTHHIRTSLVNIRGFSKELQHACQEVETAIAQEETLLRAREIFRRRWETDVQEALGFIHRSVDHMEGYLQGLTSLVRVSSFQPNIRRCKIQTIVADILNNFCIELRNRDIHSELYPLPDCLADQALLRHSLHAVIENAIRYSDSRKQSFLHISCPAQSPWIEILLEDNGLGFAPEECGKVFQPFYRIHHQHCPGQGLGLSMAQKALQIMGGQIQIESAIDKGTKVRLLLPVALGNT